MTIIRIVVTVGAFALIAGRWDSSRSSAPSPLRPVVAGCRVRRGGGDHHPDRLAVAWPRRANGVSRPFRRCLHLELAGDVFDAALPAPSVVTSSGPPPCRHSEERVPSAAAVVLRRLCNFPGMIVIVAVGLLGTITLGYATVSARTHWWSWPGASCSWP